MQSILQTSWVLADYQNWLEKLRPAKDDDYLFAKSRIRFEPNDADRLLLLDSVRPTEVNGHAAVQVSPQLPALAVPSLERRSLEVLLGTLRRRPVLVELPFVSGISPVECDKLLGVGFGRFIFAPEAMAELEDRVAAAEIVRFPASPYEIVRNYWQNVGQLSLEVDSTLGAPVDASSFMTWLRTCHVTLLLGKTFDSFYRPSSPIARRRVMPGALYTRHTQAVTTDSGTYIIDGPRINATAIGGLTYHRLLHESLNPSQRLAFDGGPDEWGQLICARARSDEKDAEWHLPPRPMQNGHFESLGNAWTAALQALSNDSSVAGVASLGRFHWHFVRLHPFACANQSLAFTLVNCVLRRLMGCGIPQLILDQLALRFDCADYIRLFERATAAWRSRATGPLERQKEYIQKRQALDRFVASLGSIESDAEADEFARQNPEAARLALLTDD